MKTARSPWYNAIVPSVAAGPIFLVGLAAAQAYGQVPKPIDVELAFLAVGLLVAIPAAIVGFVLSYFVNAIGTAILSAAGEVGEMGRDPLLWVAVGAATGMLLSILFGAFPDSGVATFALIFTSSICAGLCRAQTRWLEEC
jgi:hypothetical protein